MPDEPQTHEFVRFPAGYFRNPDYDNGRCWFITSHKTYCGQLPEHRAHRTTPNQQPDLVTEARALAEYVDGLAAGLQDVKLGRAGDRVRQLCDEVERQRTALIKLRDSTSDMWACSFADEVLKEANIDDALNRAERYSND